MAMGRREPGTMTAGQAAGMALAVALLLAGACGKRQKGIPEAPAPSSATPRTNPDWPVFRGNPALTGVADADLPEALSLAWRVDLDGEVNGAPAVGGGRVFIGTSAGTLHALALADGRSLWRHAAGAPIEAPPMLAGETVHVGDGNGVLHAVAADTGELRWRFASGQSITGSANAATLPDGQVLILFGSHDGNLYALRATDGREAWRHHTRNFINGAPAVVPGRIVFGGCDAQLRWLAADTGKREASVDVGSYLPSSPAVAGGRAYAGHYGDAFVCIDLETAAVVWEFRDPRQPAPFFAPPAVADRLVVAGARNGCAYALDRADGRLHWSFQAQGDIDAGPLVAGDKVLVAARDGRLHLLRLADGTPIWSADLGSPVAGSPALAGGLLLVATEDGALHAFH